MKKRSRMSADIRAGPHFIKPSILKADSLTDGSRIAL